MIGFYLAFLGVLLASLGARDQALVAALSLRQGQRPGVLIVAGVITLLTAALMAWLAQSLAPQLPPQARTFFAGLALVLAGGESLLFVPRRAPEEPSQSLGALAIVLAAQQMTDAARFLVLGLAVATGAPVMAGAGGAMGGLLAMAAAWAQPSLFANPGIRIARRLIGAALALAGLTVCLTVIAR